MVYDFEWDVAKARLNRSKHDVSFEEAATIFLDSRMVTVYDGRHSEWEDRWVTLGISAAGRLLVVCHTFRERTAASQLIRIISSRKATPSERRHYQE
jgi:uncharacterized DUF497 family protein